MAKKAIKQFTKSHKKAAQKRRKPRVPPRGDGSDHTRSISKHTPDQVGAKTSKTRAQQSISQLGSIADIDRALKGNKAANDGFKVPTSKAHSRTGNKGR